jgi:lipoate-protein ligase A
MAGPRVATTDDGWLSGAENLARDATALATGRAHVRVARLSDRTLSFGIGRPPSDAVADRARARGIPILHRSTGGTGVLHEPGDLVLSVILPRRHPQVGSDFVRAYDRLGAGVVAALGGLGIRARWAGPLHLSDELCLLGSRGSALSIGPRVLGGAAQHLTHDALLHHVVLARSVDRTMVSHLFDMDVAILEQRLAALTEETAPKELESLPERLLAATRAALAPTP